MGNVCACDADESTFTSSFCSFTLKHCGCLGTRVKEAGTAGTELEARIEALVESEVKRHLDAVSAIETVAQGATVAKEASAVVDKDAHAAGTASR